MPSPTEAASASRQLCLDGQQHIGKPSSPHNNHERQRTSTAMQTPSALPTLIHSALPSVRRDYRPDMGRHRSLSAQSLDSDDSLTLSASVAQTPMFSPGLDHDGSYIPSHATGTPVEQLDPPLSLSTPTDQQHSESFKYDGQSYFDAHRHFEDAANDPFLNLLQQLADREQIQPGCSELDFFSSFC